MPPKTVLNHPEIAHEQRLDLATLQGHDQGARDLVNGWSHSLRDLYQQRIGELFVSKPQECSINVGLRPRGPGPLLEGEAFEREFQVQHRERFDSRSQDHATGYPQPAVGRQENRAPP